MVAWKDLTAEQFYALRDERTATLIAGSALQNASLTISISEQEAEKLAGQLCLLLLVNLNARWCRKIDMRVPEVALHPALCGMGEGTLATVAWNLARQADPFGCFTIIARDAPATLPSSVALHVGYDGPMAAYPIMGRGWLAAAGPHLHTSSLGGDPENPLGAILAACVGTAYAMRKTLGLTPIFSDAKLSLWNMDGDDAAEDGPTLNRVILGRVLLVGTGAIGSSIAYLLPLLRPSIENMVIVDGDVVDYPNLNRVPLFFAEDVACKKVDVVRSYLQRCEINVTAIREWFSGKEINLGDFDLVVPAANERGAREEIMNNYPPLMISGSTGSQWDAYQQRHIPLLDDCLLCRFPPTKQLAPLACSTGSLSNVEPGASKETGALPFLSITGAVMAISEIAKLAFDAKPLLGNYATLWFKGTNLGFMTATKSKRPGCSYCMQSEVLEALNRKGLFTTLANG